MYFEKVFFERKTCPSTNGFRKSYLFFKYIHLNRVDI